MRNELLGKLSPFKNNLVKITEYQQTDDIIKELLKGHEKWAKEYDKISDRFWKGNLIRSCQYVFNYLKNNVKYKIEPDTRQSIKSPAAIFATGNTGYNDCKHYSSVFGGLIDSWNRKKYCKADWCYRFANYKLLSTNPHHVFVVIKKNGNEIWCDAVLNSFNFHKPYYNKIDKKPNMALYQISGIGCNECGGSCGQRSMYGMPQLSGRKERRQKRRSGEDCTGRTVPKYAPPFILGRKAFLLLIRENIFKLGLKMYYAMQHSESRAKILKKWCGMGGNAHVLKETINKFEHHYRRKHGGRIGFDPTIITTAIVNASPYIAAFTPILAAAAKFLPEGSKGRNILEQTTEAATELTDSATGSGGGQTTGSMNTNLLYGAIALGGIYLLTKKYK